MDEEIEWASKREGDQPSRGELITGFHEACPGARAKKAGFHAAETPLSSSPSKQVADKRLARPLLLASFPA